MKWLGLLGFVLCMACGPSEVRSGSGDVEPWDLRTVFQSDSDRASGVLVVRATAPREATIRRPEPAGEGLRFESLGSPSVESLGERQLYTWRWQVEGRPGNYELKEMALYGDEQEPMASAPGRFIDLATDAPVVGELEEVQHPSRVYEIPWLLLLGVVGTVAALTT